MAGWEIKLPNSMLVTLPQSPALQMCHPTYDTYLEGIYLVEFQEFCDNWQHAIVKLRLGI